MNGNWQDIEKHMSLELGLTVHFKSSTPVSGGDINDSFKLTDKNHKNWFVKTNKPSQLFMFEAESEGLQALNKSNSFRIPKSICCGKNDQYSYLVLEYLDLLPHISQKPTGQALAKMHLFQPPNHNNASEPFGWKLNNTIGSTPQSNRQHKNWLSFWKQERLLVQLDLAKSKGYPSADYDNGLKLIENLDVFFTSYSPSPSLLHGDLWSGNCASDAQGNPVIFDPAIYWGDRETDIAMTELFGGFSQDFYDAYNTSYPLDQGYKTRKQLYNLYHILNHFNLFGGNYAAQAASMTKHLLASV
jgi:fructosamine-3-kinase